MKIVRLFCVAVFACAALVAIPATPAEALPQPYPNFWPQNHRITLVYSYAAYTCTAQFQYGQYGGAAYVQFDIVQYYSNTDRCFITGQLTYNRGQGEQTYSGTTWRNDGWHHISVNPAYFIRSHFQLGYIDSNYDMQATPWEIWGSFLCPNGC